MASEITQTIGAIPEAGHRGVDVRDAFVTKQEAFQDKLTVDTVPELNQFATEANALATAVENDAITTELDKWIAEAEKLTSESYAVEAEDVEVKHYTSDGDGTFTATPQTGIYSTLHHNAKALASRNQASTFAGNASASADATELLKWEAEAWKLTAQSNANEAEDVFTNLVTSDGDGTFTYTPTSEYSATHHKLKAEAFALSIDPATLVAKADLVDNLTSTATDQAPTANMVKTLKDTADTLATTVGDKIEATDYASTDGTAGGTLKAKESGGTLYITTNGNDA